MQYFYGLLALICIKTLTAVSSQDIADLNQQAPTFSLEPVYDEVATHPGNTRILQCQASGIPPPVYQWLKDGQFVTTTNRTDVGSHRIANINDHDAGLYQCVASNEHGRVLSRSAEVRVARLVPWSMQPSPRDKTVSVGQALVIHLPPLDSFPDPVVTWYADGYQTVAREMTNSQVTLNNHLVLLNVKMSQNNRRYHASANNAYRSLTTDTEHYTIIVRNNPGLDLGPSPEIIIPPANATVNVGYSSAKFECVGNVNSRDDRLSIVYRWYRISSDDTTRRTELQSSHPKYILSLYKRTLTINNPTLDDAGVYECVVELSDNSNSVSSTAFLTVQEPAMVVTTQQTLIVDYGSDTVIDCESTGGIPTPTKQWYKNIIPIQQLNDARYTVDESGALHITEVHPRDSGVFQCFVTNPAGESNIPVWLRVQSSPATIVQAPINKSSIEGDSVNFMCDAEGAPSPSVTWYYETPGGMSVIPGTGRLQVDRATSQLRILSTELSDAGHYQCNASNIRGSDIASAHLTVISRTRITDSPQDDRAVQGTSPVLRCGVTHDSSVQVTWYWFYEHEDFDPDTESPAPIRDGHRHTVRSDGSLEIRFIRTEDVGRYTCRVVSSGGNTTASARIDVIELPHSPNVHMVTLDDSQRAVNVAWRPSYDGNSPITGFYIEYRQITLGSEMLATDGWIRLPDRISYTARLHTVRDLQPAKTYQFRVGAINVVGRGIPSGPSQEITLPQQPPSGPPRNVHASSRTNESISVQWEQPDEYFWNGPLLGYIVRYQPENYPVETRAYINVTSSSQRIEVIDSLLVFQNYLVWVAAYNSKGVGNYSTVTMARTREGTPKTPPTQVILYSPTSTSIVITWMPPETRFIRGINQGYKIELVNLDIEGGAPTIELMLSDPANLLGNQTKVMTDLDKYNRYQVRILCFTGAGDGPWSDAEVVTTLQDLPEAVGSLNFNDVRDTALIVTWTRPTHINGELLGYTLTYERKNMTATRQEIDVPAGTLRHTLSDLLPETVYTVSVWARTEVGPGPPTSLDVLSGVPPVEPEAPRSLGISNIRATSVRLQFHPGHSGFTEITEWVVEAQVRNNRNWFLLYREDEPELSSISVPNLEPHTHYRLRMIAVNRVGHSQPSIPTDEFQTLQAPPKSPPLDVTVRAVNETAVRVRWKPLSSSFWYGLGRGYTVRMRVHGEPAFLPAVSISDENANSYTFGSLEEWTPYDVQVACFNDVGNSSFSDTATDWTRESVPSAGPLTVRVEALSSTQIEVAWTAVDPLHQNGRILGYKIHYRPESATMSSSVLTIADPAVHTTLLSGLSKHTQYRIQVLAYTRMGDGVLSSSLSFARTLTDVPGPPSSIHFPYVTEQAVRMVWLPPVQPNGDITEYHVGYVRTDSLQQDVSYVTLASWIQDYNVDTLRPGVRYTFYLYATNAEGNGQVATVDVTTIRNREVCVAPRRIWSTDKTAHSIDLAWEAPIGCDNSPVRNYSLQVRYSASSPRIDLQLLPYSTLTELYVPPALTNYTVTGLQPNTQYQYRIAAYNDIGRSDYSIPTDPIHTVEAAPNMAPVNVIVIPKTPTSVMVKWDPPPNTTWNGQLLGYKVWHRRYSYNITDEVEASVASDIGWTRTEMELVNLDRGQLYEIMVNAFNARGHGPMSTPIDVYVGEAVPTESPQDFVSDGRTSDSIQLSWRPPGEDTWNGDLLGYKIYYWQAGIIGSSDTLDTLQSHIRTIAASETRTRLTNLTMYTEYSIIILAFNAAGDGPNTTVPLRVQTLEGVPSEPVNLTFVVYEPSAVNVSWSPPLQPNGFITQYHITYHQYISVDGETSSTEFTIPGGSLYKEFTGMTPAIEYVFKVAAKTSTWGEATNATVVIGPQPGSVGPPSKPQVVEDKDSVTLTWSHGHPGDGPVTGHIIQRREKGDTSWEPQARLGDPTTEAVVHFYSLKPETDYQFHVIALNKHGISEPSLPSAYISAPDVKEKPFYQQWWFLVIVGLTALIIIIIVISLLCLTGRRAANKYKDTQPTIRLEPSRPGPSTAGQSDDDIGFSTYDIRRSARRSNPKRLPANNHLPPYTRSPPRPSPGSVLYSEDDNKPYGDDDLSSSGTGKHSDYSCSDNESQISDVDSINKPPPPISEYSEGLPGYSSNGYGRPHTPSRGGAAGSSSSNYHHDATEGATAGPSYTNHYVNDPPGQSWRNHYRPTPASSHSGDTNSLSRPTQPPPTPPSRHQPTHPYDNNGAGGYTNTDYSNSHDSSPNSDYNHINYSRLGAGSSNLNGGKAGGSSHVRPMGGDNGDDDDGMTSSQYAAALNSGHIIMNNMAGSRAPLPGFSSFV